MPKIIKLIADIKPEKKVPAWKNPEIIDAVKADFIANHNKKFQNKPRDK